MMVVARQEYVETTSAVYYLGKIQVIIIHAITRAIISMNIERRFCQFGGKSRQ